MSIYLKEERVKAIKYLRSRNKWLADKNCKFTPTSAAATDVKKTWAEATGVKKPRVAVLKQGVG